MPNDPSKSPAGYAVVTGAASGIGQAIADELVRRNWKVAWIDRDEAALAHAAGDHRQFTLDIAERESWSRLESTLRTAWPRIDLLVNNAGVLIGGSLAECPVDDLLKLLDTNLKGVMLGCRTLIPWMIESRCSRPAGLQPLAGVINLSSVFAALAPPGFAAYSASKAGVLAFTESLRGELAPHGLNATVAVPGVVRTGLFERSWFASAAYRRAADRFLASAQLEPKGVAHQVLSAASKGRLHAVIGARARRMWTLKRLFPNALTASVARRAERELNSH